MTLPLEKKWEKLNEQYISHAKSLNKDHLVVSAVVMCERKILVVRRSSLDTYPGMWEFPGGGVDNGESIVVAIKREVKEESNLNLSDFPTGELMIHPTRTALRIVVQFECEDIANLSLSHEHDQAYWLELEKLADSSTMDAMTVEIYKSMRSENQSILEIVASIYLEQD